MRIAAAPLIGSCLLALGGCNPFAESAESFDPYADETGGGDDGSACAEPGSAFAAESVSECEDHPGTLLETLPGTGTSYCVAAHPDCTLAGAGCALVITLNTGGAYFGKVDEPEQWGPLIAVESYGPNDGDEVKDTLAELPRVLMQDYPGIDPDRIYLVGWSAGAGGVYRGMCHSAKGYDQSSYGTTSDLYAAIATLGGCPSCSAGFAPISGNWHVFATNGVEDQFGGQGCEDSLRALAQVNGCTQAADATWANASPEDPYVEGADGSHHAQVLGFGSCQGGDVLGYRFADEGHVVSYKQHYDPKVSAYAMIWAFLQGRRKQGGVYGPAPQCGGG
jgi:dienelactone hydrolase